MEEPTVFLSARYALFLFFVFIAMPAAAVEIDGRIDPAEWAGARHITDFRDVQPLSGKPGSMPTEAWILSTPKGLAIAFRATQDVGSRTHQRSQRDADVQVDRVNLMVDFDGDGRTGYDFEVTLTNSIADEVITGENTFNTDWDGNWKHAVSEDADSWSVEILIPWYIAPMHKAIGDTRKIGLYLDRVVGSTGERMAWPTASFKRARFLSDFEHVELPAYTQPLFAITPYAELIQDRVTNHTGFRGGADLLWKPNGQTQLTATINPDFGQVESDDLIINFGPEEIFFTDKRPFFTENQGIFDFSLLNDYTQLVYTRRVGGTNDNGVGDADIAGAVKLNGSIGATSYGVLAAQETGDAGRSFEAFRVLHDFGTQSLGALLTHVEHPYLDRDANVLGIDHRWKPNAAFTLTSNVVGSNIDQDSRHTGGFGATSVAEYDMGNGWNQQWLGMHFNDKLEINDFGYLDRNNFDYFHYEIGHHETGLPADSTYASHWWRYRISEDDTDHGLLLERRFRITREDERRDGSLVTWQLNIYSNGHDDLLTRGGNTLKKPGTADFLWELVRPRQGAWSWENSVKVLGNELTGVHRLDYIVKILPTYFISDDLSFSIGGSYEYSPNWLIWQPKGDGISNLIGAFDGHTLEFDAALNWNMSERQELRVKLQAIGVDARLRQAYEVDANMNPIKTDEHVNDFSLRNLGFQVRYRYELAPLSDLYIVYQRGGYEEDPIYQDATSQLHRSFGLRDEDELLVKLAYRFEL
jgi:hypothetical protein